MHTQTDTLRHVVRKKPAMPLPAHAPQPVSRTAAEAAHAQLKALILDNALPPGTQRLESELALQLGLSRTPVREAMLRLQQEGLVAVTPRHGMRVLPIAAADLREIYAVLTALEPMAAELLARRADPAAGLQPLAAACDAMEAALAARDRSAWAAADAAFHLGLAALCGNRRLEAMVMQVWEQSHRARLATLQQRPLPARSTAEHRRVLQAIAAGQAERAHDLYRRHRIRSGAELAGIIERSGVAWL